MIDRIIVSVRTQSRRHFAMRRRTGHAADEPAAAADAAAASPSPNARASRRSSSASARGADGATAPTLHPLLVGVACLLLTLLARHRVLHGVPSPLAIDAPDDVFSEARAMTHASVLAEDIGVRVVSTPAMDASEAYVRSEANALVELARRARADDLDVRLSTHRPSGSFALNFLNADIANAYTNLTNIVVRVAAREDPSTGGGGGGGGGGDASSSSSSFKPRSSVLLNAHFDTTLGSPGAADCAACVGILLEILRLYVVSLDPPPAPIIFLFNGGEETFMQAAHGFVAHHPWAASVGVAINVEATGSEGPDVMFRETGGWPAEVYVSTAPRPVTTPTIRDLVRFASLPVDTDFSVFRDPTEPHGNLPGIDIASMLGGYTYHTSVDDVDRVKPGMVQAYGENVFEATKAFATKISEISEGVSDVSGNESSSSRRIPVGPGTGSALFDVFGAFGVVYGPKNRVLHGVLHAVPLLACLARTTLGAKKDRRSRAARGAKTTIRAWVSAVALPAACGASRALVSGRPLVWFGKPLLTAALFAPPAAAGLLYPYADARRKSRVGVRADAPPLSVADCVDGAALVSSVLAAVVGAAGAAMGYVCALWAFGLVLAGSPWARLRRGSRTAAAATTGFFAFACLLPAAALSAPIAYVTFVLFSEKVGILGSHVWPIGLAVGDAVMGAGVGTAAVLLAGGFAPAISCSGAFYTKVFHPPLGFNT